MVKKMRTPSLTPAKSGRLYGKFTPSPLGYILIRKPDGTVIKESMNREDRRELMKRK